MLQSAWASNQIVPTGPCTRASPPKTPERERMVAAEHERQLAGLAARSRHGRRSRRRRRGSGRGTWRARRPRRAPRSGSSATVPRSCTPTPSSGEPRRAARRSGSPTAPCRRRGGPARDRAQRRGRRRAGSGGAHDSTLSRSEQQERELGRSASGPASTPARRPRPPAAARTTPPASRTSRSPAA